MGKMFTFRDYLDYRKHRLMVASIIVFAGMLLSGLSLLNTYAQDPNVPPSAGTPTVFSSSSASNPSIIQLQEGGRLTGYIEGTASDANGCTGISTVNRYSFKFYRTDIGGDGGSNCTSTDGLHCYIPSTTSLYLGACLESTTTVFYSQPFDINYFTDATEDLAGAAYSSTDWTARVRVQDDFAEVGVAQDTVEIGLLRALDVSTSINFGDMTIGTTSASTPVYITNTGNAGIDYSVGYNQDFQCERNSFPGRSVVITQNASVASSAATEMTNMASPVKVNASIAIANSMSASSTATLYNYLVIPSQSGVRGACSNTTVYTATADDGTGI